MGSSWAICQIRTVGEISRATASIACRRRVSCTSCRAGFSVSSVIEGCSTATPANTKLSGPTIAVRFPRSERPVLSNVASTSVSRISPAAPAKK
jgi:hypothetical protein